MNNQTNENGSLIGKLGLSWPWLLFGLLMFTPLQPLGFPWWVDALIVLAILLFKVVGGILCLVIWGWSFVVMLGMPFSGFSVLYYIIFAIYILFFIIPTILSNFRSRNR